MSLTVIFDLDDTLLDTSALLAARDRRAWGEVLSRLTEVVTFAVGHGEHPVERLPREARARGLLTGLYTHSPEWYARALLKTHRIRFDAMVTGSDRFPPKPDPSGLLAVARKLGAAPSECVYVGDSVGDFGAAASAGMMSVGVSWTRRTPESWRRGWPDVAVDRPSRLLRVVDGQFGLGPLAEVVASGGEVAWHWGSVVRLGAATYSLGRYFPMGDRRYPRHALSHLVIDSKNERDASTRLANVFARVGRQPMTNPPELIVSVPPAPDDERDRFDEARAALATAYDARDGGDLLVMREAVDDYKSMSHDTRVAVNAGRFGVTERLLGERILLIDDVLTSGSQSDACRDALRAAGAGSVTVMSASVTQDPLRDPCPRCGEESGEACAPGDAEATGGSSWGVVGGRSAAGRATSLPNYQGCESVSEDEARSQLVILGDRVVVAQSRRRVGRWPPPRLGHSL